MLRATIQEAEDSLTLKVEGRLAGPWALEAHDCWQNLVASKPRTTIRVDLTGVTMIDATGKALLARAHADGAELVASGCLMRAIVEEMMNSKLEKDVVDNAMPQTTY
jgi:ABC-type transporter Mla MlaB component